MSTQEASDGVQNSVKSECNSAEVLAPLANLMPVIWELVSRYITGLDILSICSVLSKAMWYRIRMGVFGEFSIRSTASITPAPLYYSFLRLMPRVTSVSLLHVGLSIWRIGPRFFEYLPPTIRSLSISLPFSLDIWLCIPHNHPLPTYDSAVVAQKVRPKVTNVRFVHSQPTFNMGALLPSMECLTIQTGDNKSIVPHIVSASMLPSQQLLKAVVQQFVQSLPSGLQHLNLPPFTSSSSNILDFYTGSHLTSVNISFDGVHEKLVVLVPESVRHLVLSTTKQPFGDDRRASALFLSKLPPLLDTFEWFDTHETDMEALLPLASHSMLRSLSMTFFRLESRYSTPVSLYSLLPRFLTHCSITAHWLDEIKMADLPRTLTSLSWTNHPNMFTYPFSSLDYCNLPSGLEVLSLKHLILMDEGDVRILPRTLTHLTISFHPALWKQLHVCKDRLCTSQCLRVANYRGGNYTLPDDVSRHLPTTLTYLKILSSHCTDAFFCNLPSSLETLDIFTYCALGHGALSGLPFSLTSLSIDTSQLHKDETLENLPSNLRFLKIVPSETVHCKIAVPLLPRSLTSLHIEKCDFLLDDNVKDLPRGLIHLIAPGSERLTTRCASDLPRGLVTLKLSKIVMQEPRPTKMELVLAFPSALPIFELNCVTAKRRHVHLENLP